MVESLNSERQSIAEQSISFPRQNNFDLIRLFAAAQVVLIHTIDHLQLPINPGLYMVIKSFPGVPIFFVISGFLISASYQRHPSKRRFFINRFLRIYPALWVCLGGSIFLAWILGGIGDEVSMASFLTWLAAQLSIGQFYNPGFLRGYGAGVLNGSLWTIPVELQFYLLTPAMVFVYLRKKRLFIALFIIFLALNVLNSMSFLEAMLPEIVVKLIGVSFLPWIALFIVGALLQKHYQSVRFLLEGKAIYWILAYCGVVYLNSWFNIGIEGNKILLPWSLLLAFTACSCAFTATGLSGVILKNNDISYGTYIYHMPIVNAVMVVSPISNWGSAIIVFSVTTILATISWKLVESPALKMKPVSNRVERT